jgi:hypothetical protein
MKKRTKARAPKRSTTARKKKAAPKRSTRKRKAATKRPRAKARKAGTKARAGKRSRAPKAPERSGTRTKRAVRPAAKARLRGAETARRRELAARGAWEQLAPRVAAQLEARGWSGPDPEVVATIAAVAAGYRLGPAADPGFPIFIDADATAADGFVDRFWTGSRSPGPDRRSRLRTVRATVDANLAQLGLGRAPDGVRDTLAWIALGIWRPALDEIARLHALAGFLVPWYRAGS